MNFGSLSAMDSGLLSGKVIYWDSKEFAVKQNFNKVISENEKVSNNYYWKSNQSEGVDCFGRALDLTNNPGQNQTYLDYRADILAIKDYERLQGNGLLGGFSSKYIFDGKTVRAV